MNKKKILFPLLAVSLGFFIPILILEITLRFLPTNEGLHPLPVNESSPVTTYEKNRYFTSSRGWDFSILAKKHSNNYGFLNAQDYTNDSQIPLMAIIGDSFVAAAQVNDNQAMHGILAQKLVDKGRVYSFGASGAPLSTYLAHAEYSRDIFKPNAMVFIIIGNDFDKSLWEYNQAPGFHYFFPSASTDAAYELKRVDYYPTLTKRIVRDLAIIRYLFLNLGWNWEVIEKKLFYPKKKEKYVGHTSANANSNRVTKSMKVIDEFFRLLPKLSGLKTSDILFVLDGMRPSLYTDSGLEDAKKSYIYILRNYFTEVASKKGYEVIDMQPIFVANHRKNGLRFEFEIDGHWNQLGHKLVAEAIESSSLVNRLFYN